MNVSTVIITGKWRGAGGFNKALSNYIPSFPNSPLSWSISCTVLAEPNELELLTEFWSACLHACSVISNSCDPHGLQPTGRLCPWDFLGKNTGMDYHFSDLQRRFSFGPETRLDHSGILCGKSFITGKRERESFWHRHQKEVESAPLVLAKELYNFKIQFSSVQSLSRVQLFVTPWTTAR